MNKLTGFIAKYQWIAIVVLLIGSIVLYYRLDIAQTKNETLSERISSLEKSAKDQKKRNDINTQISIELVTSKWKRAAERAEDKKRIQDTLDGFDRDLNTIYVTTPDHDLQCPALSDTRAKTQASIAQAKVRFLQTEVWASFCKVPANQSYSVCKALTQTTGPTRSTP